MGNLWPDMTNAFNSQLVKLCRKQIGEMPKTFIAWVPLPNEVEEKGIKEGKLEECLPYLIETAQTLERAWVTFVIMACNTLHVFAQQIQESINIPFISLIDITCEYVEKLGISTIWVLGTTGSKTYGLYKIPLEKQGIRVIEPDNQEQEMINNIIHRLVTNTGKLGDEKILTGIIDNMKSGGAEIVLLACTDLQLIIKPEDFIIDTMNLLVQKCADYISGKCPIPTKLQ